MIFNSVAFLLFFPIVCILYFMIPHRFRTVLLLAASYVFYAYADLWAVPFLLCTTIITYICGWMLYKGKRIAFVGIPLVLLFLIYFKYATYLVSLFDVTLSVDIILPVGISFYTFQSITYLMDCYRKECKPERNFLTYALFVSFFPTILSGPIERAKNLLPQFKEVHKFDTLGARGGLTLMLWGYFLKMVISGRLSILTEYVFADDSFGGLAVLLAVLAYTLQIYCDFAGYSYLAIGVGRILGFRIMDNFRQPYLAESIPDFWRRWHISLSSWFRDYLYIPLGGNRKGTFRKYLNVMIVFALSGIWHGANLTFLVWGLLNGLYQVIGGLLKPIRIRISARLGLDSHESLRLLLRRLFTFILIAASWVFFRAPSVSDAIEVFGRLFRGPYLTSLLDGTVFRLGLGVKNLLFVILAIVILIAADVLCEKKDCDVRGLLVGVKWPIRWLCYYTLIIMILFSCNLSTQEFMYMSF